MFFVALVGVNIYGFGQKYAGWLGGKTASPARTRRLANEPDQGPTLRQGWRTKGRLPQNHERRAGMETGQKLVIIGMGGVGGPAAMLARRLLPGVDITVIREEDRFIVR